MYEIFYITIRHFLYRNHYGITSYYHQQPLPQKDYQTQVKKTIQSMCI